MLCIFLTDRRAWLRFLLSLLFVPCGTTADETLKVRLSDGADDMEGRVEVYYNGSWGTVCDDDWDTKDAMVVCRMLGFPMNAVALRNAAFGPGRGTIILDHVECNGVEESLAECQHRGFINSDCHHRDDAGVRCLSKFDMFTICTYYLGLL